MKHNRKQVMSVLVSATFLWTSVLWTPAVYAQSAQAQPGKLVKPSAAQLELNDAGVQAIIDKNYDLAVQIFNSSLALGPINITYLNRGRALQHAGKCEQAEESYVAAYSAPAMAEPSAQSVAGTLDRYRKELQETCTGKLLLKCEPVEISVSIDGRNIGQCPSTPIALEKGEYRIRGTLMGKSVESLADISPMKTLELSLKVDAPDSSVPPRQTVEQPRQPVPAYEVSEGVTPPAFEGEVIGTPMSKGSAAVLLGAGLVLLTTAMVRTSTTDSNFEYFGEVAMPAYLYGSGILFSIYGLVRVLD